MALVHRISRSVDGREVPGTFRGVFLHDAGTYFHTELKIYADGALDCWGLISFGEFRAQVESGRVVTAPPDGAMVSMHWLCSLRASEPTAWFSPRDLLREVADIIEELNGRASSAQRLRATLDAFRGRPDEEARRAVRIAHDAVPGPALRALLQETPDAEAVLRSAFEGGPLPTSSGVYRGLGDPSAPVHSMSSVPQIDVNAVLAQLFPGSKPGLAHRVKATLDALYKDLLEDDVAAQPARSKLRNGDPRAALVITRERAQRLADASSSRPRRMVRVGTVLHRIGECFFELRQFDEARSTFEAACRCDPDSMSVYGLARIAVARNDAALARRAMVLISQQDDGVRWLEDTTATGGLDAKAFRKLAGSAVPY